MKIKDFVEVNMSLEGPAALATSFNIILFLADVTKDEVLNWEPGQVTKIYGEGEIDNDFPSTSRTYKVAQSIFEQNPSVSSFKVGRREPGQTVADALDVIENQDQSWYALVGTRGLSDILSAAAWIEARRKFHFCSGYDQDIGTSSDSSIAAILKSLGYNRTTFFYNNQAGYQFPSADLTLTVTDGICEAVVANGPQTEKVGIDAVVEAFTYTIDIDGEVVSYTTAEKYNTQINKITILRAVDSFVYRVTIEGVSISYTATVPTDTEEDIQVALRAAINANVVLQQKMSAIVDPDDTSALRLIGQEQNIGYEVLVGANLLDTPITVLVPPTQSEIAAILHQKLLENAIISDLAYLTITDGGESIQVSVKDATDTFVMTISANLTKTIIVFDYKFKIGDPITVFGATDLKLNGNEFITEVPAANKFQFPTTAANGVATGDITIDWNFVFPDAKEAGMGLAYPNGSLDWAFQDIIGVRPEDEVHLTGDVVANLKANNANWFHVTAGKRLFWEGRVVSGLFIDIVIDGLDYLPTRMEEAVFNFLTSLPKLPMSDATMTALKATMDQVLEIEGKQRGITAPFLEDRVRYPLTGFPAGARPGDHYVSRVPRVRDIPLADRQNRRVTSGIEFEFQTAGGLHVLVVGGTLKQ